MPQHRYLYLVSIYYWVLCDNSVPPSFSLVASWTNAVCVFGSLCVAWTHHMLTKGISFLFTLAHEYQEELMPLRCWTLPGVLGYKIFIPYTQILHGLIFFRQPSKWKHTINKIKLLQRNWGQWRLYHLVFRIHGPGLRNTLLKIHILI